MGRKGNGREEEERRGKVGPPNKNPG